MPSTTAALGFGYPPRTMPPTEAGRALRRIGLNYIRLSATLVIGVVFVRAVVGWLGVEAFGLVSFVGASIGLAGAFRQLTNLGLVRELGAALHDRDPDVFRRTYASAFLVTAGVAGVCAACYTAVVVLLPLFRIPDEWLGAARIMAACQGLYAALVVFLAPSFALYQVRERFGWYAVWMILDRGSGLAAVVILAFGFGVTDVATGLIAYGAVQAGLAILTLLVAVTLVVTGDAKFRPHFGSARRDTARQVFGTFGWNGAVHVSMLLYENGTAILMNLAHGLLGNGVYALGLRLTAYVRMATTGVTFGTDATAARLSADRGAEAVPLLARHTTRFQALVALPAAVLVVTLAEPLLTLWVGVHIDDPDVIARAVVVVRILAIAIAGRALADGWMAVLYGSGSVRRYAPVVLIGGITSPLAGLLLLVLLPKDSPWHFFAPPIAYAGVFTIFQVGVLPFLAGRAMNVPAISLLAPALRPAVVAAIGVPVLLGTWRLIGGGSGLLALGGTCAVYGTFIAIAAWGFVLDGVERRRLARMITRRGATP